MPHAAPAVAGPSDPPRVYSTPLALVQSLQTLGSSEDEVVETAMALVNSGRVVLTGNFKGCRFEHWVRSRLPSSGSASRRD